MKAHLINTHLLVPRSRSSAKVTVKYKGYISQKMAVWGGIHVSQTHFVYVKYFNLKYLDIKSLICYAYIRNHLETVKIRLYRMCCLIFNLYWPRMRCFSTKITLQFSEIYGFLPLARKFHLFYSA